MPATGQVCRGHGPLLQGQRKNRVVLLIEKWNYPSELTAQLNAPLARCKRQVVGDQAR